LCVLPKDISQYIPLQTFPHFARQAEKKNELLAGSSLKAVALAPKTDRNLPAKLWRFQKHN
jgi:hypothetical protein